jgi:hypothetical protein
MRPKPVKRLSTVPTDMTSALRAFEGIEDSWIILGAEVHPETGPHLPGFVEP